MKTQTIRKRQRQGLFYITPWIIGFLLLQLYPLISSFFYSFTNYNLGGNFAYVGIENFKKLLVEDTEFWNSLKITLTFVFVSVPCKLAFALFIAMLLNQKVRFVGFFRTLYYVPSILGSSVAVSVVWRMLFLPSGIINNILKSMALPTISWLGKGPTALLTLVLLSVWQFGSSMIIFLAGLKQIPSELYDSAKVDGANAFRAFFSITIPLLTPMVFFNIVMQMINAFQEFTSAYIITNGGPLKATYLFGLKLYTEAFVYFKIGYASALSWIMFIVIVLFTLVLFKSSDRWVYYQDGGK